MRTVTLSDDDESLLKDAIRNQIDSIDNLNQCIITDDLRAKYVDLVYRTSGYVV